MSDWDDIKGEIGNIFTGKWETRDGAQVPEPEDVQLGNNAVKLEGTVLYADLVESTDLVNSYKDWFAAEVYKSFLRGACRLIQRNRGKITAFDGDRVMAVYIGDSQSTDAVGTALEINYLVTRIVVPMIVERYTLKNFQLQHAVGVDRSPLFAARTGVRGSNDLVWVGRAANYAAKLSSLREPKYATIITTEVLNALDDSVKTGKNSEGRKVSMWTADKWIQRGIDIFGSNWYRGPA